MDFVLVEVLERGWRCFYEVLVISVKEALAGELLRARGCLGIVQDEISRVSWM